MARWNRSRLRSAAALAVAGVALLAVLGGSAAAAGRSVAIKDASFSPATITIRAGDTITWTNRSTDIPHNVIFSTFGSDYMNPGDRYGHTFKTPGTFRYACTLHSFYGKVVVVRAATPKPTRKPTPKPALAPTPTPTPTPTPAPTPSPTLTSSPTPTPSPSPSPSATVSPSPVPSVAGPTSPTADSSGLPIAIIVALVVAGLVGVGTVVARRR
jgi:plastocyanin